MNTIQGQSELKDTLLHPDHSHKHSFLSDIFRIKPLLNLPTQQDGKQNEPSLQRSLTLLSLIIFGIGNTIGAGIFALLGVAAYYSGPSLCLSFLICGVVVYQTALVFAEFTSRMPLTGSQYQYIYSTFGELPAWIVGWNLNLRYGISAGALIRGWSPYVVALFATFSLNIPKPLYSLSIFGYDCSILSVLYLIASTYIVTRGVNQSDLFNKTLTTFKVVCLILIIIVALTQFKSSNFTPFYTEQFGFSGTISAIIMVFFACIGFDFISTLAEEAKNPKKDLPIACYGSVLITTSIYILIAISVCGMYKIELFNGASTALADAFGAVGFSWMQIIIYIAAIFGIAGSAFTKLMSQPRILYAYARDGLFFKIFAEIDEKTKIPIKGAWISCVFVSFVCFFLDLQDLSQIIALGTLINYSVINAGLIALRYRKAQDASEFDIERSKYEIYPFLFLLIALLFGLSIGQEWGLIISILLGTAVFTLMIFMAFIKQEDIPAETFKCPFVPFVPCAGIIMNCVLLSYQPMRIWIYFLIFELIGLTFYVFYGRQYSKLHLYFDSLRGHQNTVTNA